MRKWWKDPEMRVIVSDKIRATMLGDKQRILDADIKLLNIKERKLIGVKMAKYIDAVSKAIRKDAQYMNWRSDVLLRDKVCVLCGDDKRLHVDHFPIPLYKMIHRVDVKYTTARELFDALLQDPIIFDVNNGRVLCKECHYWDTKRIMAIRRNNKNAYK